MNFGEEIVNNILGKLDKEIVDYNLLEDYLESKSLEQLQLVLVSFLYCFKSEGLIGDLTKVTSFDKEKVMKIIKDNLHDIVFTGLLFLTKSDIEFLETLVAKGNNLILEDEKDFPSLLFLNSINSTILLDAYYDKETSKLHMNIQRDVYKEMKEILKSKSFAEKLDKIILLRDNLEKIMDVYGLIEEEELYDLYNKEFERIEFDEFRDLLDYVVLGTGIIKYSFVAKTKYVVILDLEISFEDYLKSVDDSFEYKMYDKAFYDDIHNLNYLKSLNSYQVLYKYLKSYYDLDLEKEEELFQMIVVDYIYQMQENIDKKIAQKNVLNNMAYFFDNSSKEKREILRYLNRIYYDYPKWKKKGNI